MKRILVVDGDTGVRARIAKHARMEGYDVTEAGDGETALSLSRQLWGDRIFEKCGIGRDEGGDGGKTLEIRGKRRLSARDGGANYQQS